MGSSDDGVLAVVEHHVPANKYQSDLIAWASSIGRKTFGVAARPSTQAERKAKEVQKLTVKDTSAGAAIFPLTPLCTERLDGHGVPHDAAQLQDWGDWVGMVWKLKGVSVIVLSLYMQCSLGMDGRNLQVFMHLMGFLSGLMLPW